MYVCYVMVSDFLLIGTSLVFSFCCPSSLRFVKFSLMHRIVPHILRLIQGAVDVRIDCLPSLGFYYHSEYVKKNLRKQLVNDIRCRLPQMLVYKEALETQRP